MERLALALCVALVAAELAGASTTPAGNLSCFQCYKVTSSSLCEPFQCPTTARVCVSNEVYLYRRSRIRTLISKRCAPRCPNSNSKFEWSSGPGLRGQIIRSCCSGKLCNRAPAALETTWALPKGLLLQVGLGILWTLL